VKGENKRDKETKRETTRKKQQGKKKCQYCPSQPSQPALPLLALSLSLSLSLSTYHIGVHLSAINPPKPVIIETGISTSPMYSSDPPFTKGEVKATNFKRGVICSPNAKFCLNSNLSTTTPKRQLPPPNKT